MKILKKIAAFGFVLSSFAEAQTSGPNTPPLGSIVPEEISFTLATQSAAELEGADSLGAVERRDYTEFSGQVLVVVYHASW